MTKRAPCKIKDAVPGTGRTVIIKMGIIITFVCVALFVYRPALITLVNHKLYDVMHSSLCSKGNALPVIVDIDDYSLEHMGQWPWPRYMLGELFSFLKDAEPMAVGIDIILSEPDRSSLSAALKMLGERSGLTLLSNFLTESLPDNDNDLADVLKTGPFVLATKLLDHKTLNISKSQPLKATIVSQKNQPVISNHFQPWRGMLSPLPIFTDSVENTGFANAFPDTDGIIRRTPFIAEYNGKFYPSLSLATLMQATDTKNIVIRLNLSGIESIAFKQFTVPLSPDGHLLLKYRKSHASFKRFSVAHILEGKISPSEFKNKIIFIGASASGLGDHHSTPGEQFLPGMYIHATAADNILNGNTLSRPPWAQGSELFLIFMAGLLSTLVILRLKPITCTISLLLVITFLYALEFFLLQEMSLHISVIYPILLILSNFSVLSLIRFRIGEKIIIEKTRDLVTAQNLTIIGITALASIRDKETGMHIKRTATFVRILAEQLSHRPKYRDILDEHTIELMYKSAPMHDMGKVSIRDAVLSKPGKLTREEFQEIKAHTENGWLAIKDAEFASGIDRTTSFLSIAKDIVRYHHEKWDGSGYNHGLKGEEIPLSARIMALADVYDALTSKRVYKDAFHHDRAYEIIVEARGIHFDPEVVDAFLEVRETFQKIAIDMADE